MKCKVPTKTLLRRLVNFYEIHSSKELMDFIFFLYSFEDFNICRYLCRYITEKTHKICKNRFRSTSQDFSCVL